MRVPCSNPRAIRINHIQGERLRAADLQGELDVESWMRQLHMVGLHDTWGIALGLAASLENGAGRGVRVTAGLAYDARGRPLLLPAPHVAPNPWVPYPGADPSASFDLVLIADAERKRRPATRDDLLCLTCGEVPLRDRPALVWMPSASVRIGIDVALVRARRADPKGPFKPGDPPPPLTLDYGVRRIAASQARPFIAAGATTTPDQAWVPWFSSNQRYILGFETVVDVSQWGFATAPTLLAQLVLNTSGTAGVTPLVQLANVQQLILTHVELNRNTWAGQFRFRVIPANTDFLDPTTVSDRGLGPGQSYRSPFQIAWVGVEPAAGCPVGSTEDLGTTRRCCAPPANPQSPTNRSLS